MARSTRPKVRRRTKAAEAAPVLNVPDDAWKLLLSQVKTLEQEQFWAISINIHNRVLGVEMIAKGTVSSVDVHPRDVFRFAVRENASGVIVAHNHPSGDPTPSANDLELTKRLRAAGVILGVPVIDHLVITVARYTSISQHLGNEF